MSHRSRHGSLGFSLLETMVAVAVLGIGVVMLIRLFATVERGQSWNRGTLIARTMANQRLDFLTTQGGASLPTCTAPPGCRQSSTTYTPPIGAAAGFECTQFSADGTVPDPSVATAEAKYRLDTIVADHPDAARFPNTRIVTVSVCWADVAGTVQQSQAQRAVVDGI